MLTVLPLPAAAPDTSSFQYDETSGYYYDATTSLYYDANSQYFYNSATQRYLYWDAARSKYVPMPTDGDQSAPGGSGKKREDKHEKVKVAKKIAKVRRRSRSLGDVVVWTVGVVCKSFEFFFLNIIMVKLRNILLYD